MKHNHLYIYYTLQDNFLNTNNYGQEKVQLDLQENIYHKLSRPSDNMEGRFYHIHHLLIHSPFGTLSKQINHQHLYKILYRYFSIHRTIQFLDRYPNTKYIRLCTSHKSSPNYLQEDNYLFIGTHKRNMGYKFQIMFQQKHLFLISLILTAYIQAHRLRNKHQHCLEMWDITNNSPQRLAFLQHSLYIKHIIFLIMLHPNYLKL